MEWNSSQAFFLLTAPDQKKYWCFPGLFILWDGRWSPSKSTSVKWCFILNWWQLTPCLSVIGNSIHLVHCLKVKVCMFAHKYVQKEVNIGCIHERWCKSMRDHTRLVMKFGHNVPNFCNFWVKTLIQYQYGPYGYCLSWTKRVLDCIGWRRPFAIISCLLRSGSFAQTSDANIHPKARVRCIGLWA